MRRSIRLKRARLDQRRNKDHAVADVIEKDQIRRLRAFRAAAIVLIVVALPLCIEKSVPSAQSTQKSSLPESAYVQSAQKLLKSESNSSPLDALDRIEETSLSGRTEDRNAFSGEIEIPLQATEFRFAPDSSIFSFEMTGSCVSVLEQIAALWALQGWQEIPLGNSNGSTFVKNEGVYQWMVVTCTQIGAQVCVVGNPLPT